MRSSLAVKSRTREPVDKIERATRGRLVLSTQSFRFVSGQGPYADDIGEYTATRRFAPGMLGIRRLAFFTMKVEPA
jgi:hypothetical protein